MKFLIQSALLVLILLVSAVTASAQAPADLQGVWRAVEYVDEDDERITSSAPSLIVFAFPPTAVVAEDPDDMAFKKAGACTLTFAVTGELIKLTPAVGSCPEPVTAETSLRFRLTGDELVLYNDAVPNRTAYKRVGTTIR